MLEVEHGSFLLAESIECRVQVIGRCGSGLLSCIRLSMDHDGQGAVVSSPCSSPVANPRRGLRGIGPRVPTERKQCRTEVEAASPGIGEGLCECPLHSDRR